MNEEYIIKDGFKYELVEANICITSCDLFWQDDLSRQFCAASDSKKCVKAMVYKSRGPVGGGKNERRPF
jgi:hypothetical protein